MFQRHLSVAILCFFGIMAELKPVTAVQFLFSAGVAQLVEQLICNHQVVGSTPITSSILNGM